MNFKTETGATVRVRKPSDGEGLILSFTMEQEGDGRHAEVLLSVGEAQRLINGIIATDNDVENGRWSYGAVISEPGEELEVVNANSTWSFADGLVTEPYESAESVRQEWPGHPIVRQFIPNAGPWEPVE